MTDTDTPQPRTEIRDGRVWVDLGDGEGLTEVCDVTRTVIELLALAGRFGLRAHSVDTDGEAGFWQRRRRLTRAAALAVAS